MRRSKSELILQFGKNHPTLYLVGKRAPADQMMREFLEGAAIFLEEPLLASMLYSPSYDSSSHDSVTSPPHKRRMSPQACGS